MIEANSPQVKKSWGGGEIHSGRTKSLRFVKFMVLSRIKLIIMCEIIYPSKFNHNSEII